MPTYEYKCTACEDSFEALQNISDDPLTTCPGCKGNIRRIIGKNILVNFKGSGFYVTDNASKSSSSAVNTSK